MVIYTYHYILWSVFLGMAIWFLHGEPPAAQPSTVHGLCSWNNLQFLTHHSSCFMLIHNLGPSGNQTWQWKIPHRFSSMILPWKPTFRRFSSHGWFWRVPICPSLGKTWAPFPRRATCIWCRAEFWHRFQEHRDLATEVNCPQSPTCCW